MEEEEEDEEEEVMSGDTASQQGGSGNPRRSSESSLAVTALNRHQATRLKISETYSLNLSTELELSNLHLTGN